MDVRVQSTASGKWSLAKIVFKPPRLKVVINIACILQFNNNQWEWTHKLFIFQRANYKPRTTISFNISLKEQGTTETGGIQGGAWTHNPPVMRPSSWDGYLVLHHAINQHYNDCRLGCSVGILLRWKKTINLLS